MDEKVRKTVERVHQMDHGLAESTAHKAIGEVAVQLHQLGEELTASALVARLLSDVQGLKPDHLLRMRNESAARLLGWQS